MFMNMHFYDDYMQVLNMDFLDLMFYFQKPKSVN